MYNPFPATYAPVYPYTYQTPPQDAQTAPQSVSNNDGGVLFVDGIEGANSWVVQAGRKVFLMDRNANTFYIKSVNPNGMPNPLEIYDYKRRETAQTATESDSKYVTHEELEERLAALKKPVSRRTKKEVEND